VPHYYLGKALKETGDCAGALAAFQTSMQLGVIQQVDEYQDFQTAKSACEVAVVDLTEFMATANQALENLQSANARFARLSDESALRGEWTDRWEPRLSDSSQLLGVLRNDLSEAEAQRSQAAIEAVTSRAREGKRSIDGAHDLAQARVAVLKEQQVRVAQEQRARASRQLAQAVAAAQSLTPPRNAGESVVALHRSVITELSRAESIGDDASTSSMLALAREINAATRRFSEAAQAWRLEQQEIATRTPPPMLQRLAEVYFSGDYAETRRLADPAQVDDERVRIQIHLFRAAASYKLFVLTGEEESAHLRQAEEDVKAIKAIDDGFSPYISAFSPRFLDFFRNT
jgi:hypothetical protein